MTGSISVTGTTNILVPDVDATMQSLTKYPHSPRFTLPLVFHTALVVALVVSLVKPHRPSVMAGFLANGALVAAGWAPAVAAVSCRRGRAQPRRATIQG